MGAQHRGSQPLRVPGLLELGKVKHLFDVGLPKDAGAALALDILGTVPAGGKAVQRAEVGGEE